MSGDSKPVEKPAPPGAPPAKPRDDLRPAPKHSPGLRSTIHFLGLIMAFPLTWLAAQTEWPHGGAWAAGVCLAATVFNLFLLQPLSVGLWNRTLKREGEGFVNGTWMYPLGLAMAFLFYPAWAVGAAWAALAAGDAAAVTVGTRVPRPRLPWNEGKSWAGLVAFVAAALPCCALLLYWTPAPIFLKASGAPELPYVWTLAVIAAASGAILESLDGPFDDNLRVVLGVGLVVWLAALFLSFGTRDMPPGRHLQPEWFLHALLVNAALAAAVLFFGFADLPGALAGGALGALIYFFALPQGYALLAAFVFGGSLLSRVGRATKEARGAAEPRGGRRGISNVAANLLVPALCCLAYPVTAGHPAALLAFAGALAAALADTASSEIGALASKPPKLITTREEVAHGANGAVTALGFAAAGGGALLFGALAWLSGFWHVVDSGHDGFRLAVDPGRGACYVLTLVLAGLFGTTVDSVLGARLEGKAPGFGKGAVNFCCTLAGAGLAAAVGVYI
ncbi:MAG: DUF92 domain-containing protein [Planctomycetota bacterium]|nr:DUF92 domain-containing protein [Planctomycetota bacterium]